MPVSRTTEKKEQAPKSTKKSTAQPAKKVGKAVVAKQGKVSKKAPRTKRAVTINLTVEACLSFELFVFQ
jgi:hypothetical protein